MSEEYSLEIVNPEKSFLSKKIDGLLTYHLPDELLGIIWKGKFKGQGRRKSR